MKTKDNKQVVILPYGNGKSEGAKLLSEHLGATRIGGHDEMASNHLVINWGNGSYIPSGKHAQIVNTPPHVLSAIDKVSALDNLSRYGVRTPEYTTSKEEALKWFREGAVVVCRSTTTGKAGEGISVFSLKEGKKEVDFPTCPLYTKFINWTYEYRVHVVAGKVIHTRKKVKPDAGVTGDQRIASHLNGWLFIKEFKDNGMRNFTPPPDVLREAPKAVASLGLIFAGVDVIYDQLNDKAYVLEVNTAPGLEISEAKDYAKAFKTYCKAA